MLPLPSPEYVAFRNSPLKVVVFQLNFPLLLTISQPEHVAKFQERVQAEYPILEQGQRVASQVFVAAGNAMAPPASITSTPLWNFSDKDQKWLLTLAQDFLGLQTTAYRDFPDFSSRLLVILKALAETIGPPLQQRVGLRYVNEIRHESGTRPSAWKGLLKEELVGVVDESLIGDVTQSLQDIRVSMDGSQFVMKHGFFSEKSPLPGPMYLLDFDCFNEQPKPFDPEAVITSLASYNDAVYRVFRWAIQEKELFSSFEPVKQ